MGHGLRWEDLPEVEAETLPGSPKLPPAASVVVTRRTYVRHFHGWWYPRLARHEFEEILK